MTISMTVCRDSALKHFERTCKNYHESVKNLYEGVIFVDTMFGDIVKEVRDILDNNGLRHWEIVTSNEVLDEWRKVNYNSESVLSNYKGRMLILMDWYLVKILKVDKVLILEEDVLILSDIKSIFDKNNCAVFQTIQGAGPFDMDLGETERVRLQNLFQVCGVEFKYTNYLGRFHLPRCFGSPRYLVANSMDIDYYEKCLIRLDDSHFFLNELTKSTAWHCHNLDERFHTVVLSANKLGSLNPYVRQVCQKVHKITDSTINSIKRLSKPLVHLCIKDKDGIYKLFIDKGVITDG